MHSGLIKYWLFIVSPLHSVWNIHPVLVNGAILKYERPTPTGKVSAVLKSRGHISACSKLWIMLADVSSLERNKNKNLLSYQFKHFLITVTSLNALDSFMENSRSHEMDMMDIWLQTTKKLSTFYNHVNTLLYILKKRCFAPCCQL